MENSLVDIFIKENSILYHLTLTLDILHWNTICDIKYYNLDQNILRCLINTINSKLSTCFIIKKGKSCQGNIKQNFLETEYCNHYMAQFNNYTSFESSRFIFNFHLHLIIMVWFINGCMSYVSSTVFLLSFSKEINKTETET